MSEQSEQIPWKQLTLLPVGSHARMSPLQASAKGLRRATVPASGSSSTESFVSYDRATSSWRTSQACLLTGWEEFSEIWPKAGTMRSGKCYQRQMSEHPTSGGESGLLPAMTVSRRGNKSYGPNAKYRPSLQEMAEKGRWPTPTSRDWKAPGPNGRWRMGKLQLDTLDRAVQHWPTPTVQMSRPDMNRQNRPASGSDDLGSVIKKQTGGQLNPTWVEWLMGFPLGWTDLKPSETPSSPNAPNTSEEG